jgi:hypothetical protein
MSQATSQVQDLSWLITDFTERVPDVGHAAVGGVRRDTPRPP